MSEPSSESTLEPEVMSLVEDMGAFEPPLVKMSFSDAESSLSDGSGSDATTTSHEFGNEIPGEDLSTGSEVEGAESEVLWSRPDGHYDEGKGETPWTSCQGVVRVFCCGHDRTPLCQSYLCQGQQWCHDLSVYSSCG